VIDSLVHHIDGADFARVIDVLDRKIEFVFVRSGFAAVFADIQSAAMQRAAGVCLVIRSRYLHLHDPAGGSASPRS
jgi:hypothetical protein